MEALVIILALLFLVWWLSLDKPIRSLSRSLNTLASAGELKAAGTLAEVAEDVDLAEMKDIKAKLEILKGLEL